MQKKRDLFSRKYVMSRYCWSDYDVSEVGSLTLCPPRSLTLTAPVFKSALGHIQHIRHHGSSRMWHQSLPAASSPGWPGHMT